MGASLVPSCYCIYLGLNVGLYVENYTLKYNAMLGSIRIF
jgi:hypothetical protein